MTNPYALSTEIVSGVAVITIDLPGELTCWTDMTVVSSVLTSR